MVQEVLLIMKRNAAANLGLLGKKGFNIVNC
jgi:hypothetical protein